MISVFALSDVHLSLSTPNKAMDVFGAHWDRHTERIYQAWQDTVGEDDLVLIPGDISWAMYLCDAMSDLNFLNGLKGKKVIMRGNHDYWWSGYSKVVSALGSSMMAIQNNTVTIGDYCIGGSRYWLAPQCSGYSEKTDKKIFERELIRLQLSLGKMSQSTLNIAMLHYPPFSEKGMPTAAVDIIESHNIAQVVYGHLHGKAQQNAFEGERNGIAYSLVACDRLDFTPKRIV